MHEEVKYPVDADTCTQLNLTYLPTQSQSGGHLAPSPLVKINIHLLTSTAISQASEWVPWLEHRLWPKGAHNGGFQETALHSDDRRPRS